MSNTQDSNTQDSNTEQQAVVDAMLQLNDNMRAFVESATGIKAMALESGFRPIDASRMGADSFNFVLTMAVKGA